MIKYLVFNMADTAGWDAVDNAILTKLRENDPLFSAEKYAGKICNVANTLCAMSIYTDNPVIMSALTQAQKDVLVEIQPDDVDWVG